MIWAPDLTCGRGGLLADLDSRTQAGARADVPCADSCVDSRIARQAGASPFTRHPAHAPIRLRESACHLSLGLHGADHRAEPESEPRRDLAPTHAFALDLEQLLRGDAGLGVGRDRVGD